MEKFAWGRENRARGGSLDLKGAFEVNEDFAAKRNTRALTYTQ